jgi:hypothetical protein
MQFHIERLEVQPAAVVRAHVAFDGIPAFLAGAYAEVLDVVATQVVAVAGPPFARYAMSDRGFDVEAGFPTRSPVAPTGRVEAGELPGGPAIVVLHRGYRHTLGGLSRWPRGRRAEDAGVHALSAHLTPAGGLRAVRI